MRAPSIIIAIIWASAMPWVFSAQAQPSARTLPDVKVEQLVEQGRVRFWHEARTADGEPFTPADEAERLTLLIPESNARRIVNDAFGYGIAEMCGVDWRHSYSMYMQRERNEEWSEKQLAFIAFLFGGVQRSAVISFSDYDCQPKLKAMIQEFIDDEEDRLRAELPDGE